MTSITPRLQNIVDMCDDATDGKWPAAAAIPEIRKVAAEASALLQALQPAPDQNQLAVKLAELMAAHRDGMDGSDCSDINDPGSCGKCDTLDAAIKALSAAPPSGSAPERSDGACINCGERNQGGYVTGGEGINAGNVGSFCETCWDYIREHFYKIEPDPAPAGDSAPDDGDLAAWRAWQAQGKAGDGALRTALEIIREDLQNAYGTLPDVIEAQFEAALSAPAAVATTAKEVAGCSVCGCGCVGTVAQSTPIRQRSIEQLRGVVSMLANFIWHRCTRPGDRLWSIPADPERDWDFILTDAIDELELLRNSNAPVPSVPPAGGEARTAEEDATRVDRSTPLETERATASKERR